MIGLHSTAASVAVRIDLLDMSYFLVNPNLPAKLQIELRAHFDLQNKAWFGFDNLVAIYPELSLALSLRFSPAQLQLVHNLFLEQ